MIYKSLSVCYGNVGKLFLYTNVKNATPHLHNSSPLTRLNR